MSSKFPNVNNESFKTGWPFSLPLTPQARRLIGVLKCQSDKIVLCPFETEQAAISAISAISAIPQNTGNTTRSAEEHLLHFAEHRHYRTANKQLNLALRRIADYLNIPHFTSYAARHTFASIAAHLQIPRDTIAELLGHSRTVTDIYIKVDTRLADQALVTIVNAALPTPAEGADHIL